MQSRGRGEWLLRRDAVRAKVQGKIHLEEDKERVNLVVG